MLSKLNVIVLVTISWTACSCASILNRSTMNLEVRAKQPMTIVFEGETYELQARKTEQITVPRQKKTLTIEASAGVLNRTYTVKPVGSFAYHMNWLTYGIGFLFDKGPKRYGYDPVFLDIFQKELPSRKYAPPTSKQVNFVLSMPWINNFFFQPEGEPTKHNTGFVGWALGVEKHYRPNRFLGLTGGFALDFFLPVPVPIHYEGEMEAMGSIYFTLTNNHMVGQWCFGYGLNYSENIWIHDYREVTWMPPTIVVRKTRQTLGFTMSGNYQFTRSFYLGLLYRPSLLTINPAEWKYEHAISVEVGWRIRLTKKPESAK